MAIFKVTRSILGRDYMNLSENSTKKIEAEGLGKDKYLT